MGQYFCILLGTGAISAARIAAVSALAASWGKAVLVNSQYICVIIGTGEEAGGMATALIGVAATWGAETCTGDSPCC